MLSTNLVIDSACLPIGFDRIYDCLCECAGDRFLFGGAIGDGLVFEMAGRSGLTQKSRS